MASFSSGGEAETFTIEAGSSGSGSIVPFGKVKVEKGQSQSFNFIPEDGAVLISVEVDGVDQGKITSYTFSDVGADHSIKATFAYEICNEALAGYYVSYTKSVSYNGRAHIEEGGKVSAKKAGDVKIEVFTIDSQGNKTILNDRIKKVVFKNNKNAAQSTANKAPQFMIKMKGLDKAITRAFSTQVMKFSIAAGELSADNVRFTNVKKDNQGLIKSVKCVYIAPDGTEVKLKYTKNTAKSDFSIDAQKGTITGLNNFTGTVEIKV